MINFLKYSQLLFCLLLFLSVSAGNKLKIKKNETNLLIFFSPTCPICQYYTHDINNLVDSLKFPIHVIIPKYSLINQSELTKYIKNYSPTFSLFYDKRNKYVKEYKPTITPEFFLLKNNIVMYKGAFDDSFLNIGQRKFVVENQYLINAINAVINNNYNYEKETKAIGCFITY